MELYQLRYFARAAAYENISMAAQDLHMTQPSISKAVKALEKELQVELMRRNGKYCELTHEAAGFRPGSCQCWLSWMKSRQRSRTGEPGSRYGSMYCRPPL